MPGLLDIFARLPPNTTFSSYQSHTQPTLEKINAILETLIQNLQACTNDSNEEWVDLTLTTEEEVKKTEDQNQLLTETFYSLKRTTDLRAMCRCIRIG